MARFSFFTRAVAAADLPSSVATDAEVATAVSGLTTAAAAASAAAALIATHEADTSSVHGITDTTKVTTKVVQSTATGGNTDAGEDTIITVTIPAGTLAANGDALVAEAAGTIATSINQKRIRVKFGTTTIFDTGATGIPISAAIDWNIQIRIIRTGAATQKATVTMNTSNATLAAYCDYTTPAETLANALPLLITGEAVATNETVAEFLDVMKVPA